MIQASKLHRMVALLVSGSMIATPAMAAPAAGMQDLVGARAGQAENTITARGWTYVAGDKTGSQADSFWWHAGRKECIKVTTADGRYTAIDEASASDCKQKSGGNGATIAAVTIGAVAIGALLLSRKSKDRNSSGTGYEQQRWQQVEVQGLQGNVLNIFSGPSKNDRVVGGVGAGAMLRNYGCEDVDGESWCEVRTMDERIGGWARDRYLQAVPDGAGQYSGGNSGQGYQSYGYNQGELVEVYGLQSGALQIMAGPSKSDAVRGRVDAGATLRRMGCQTVSGEVWCEVSTLDGRLGGWARERYLRRTGGAYGGGPSSNSGWNSSASEVVEVYGLKSGTLQIMAGPTMSDAMRGGVGAGTLLRRSSCLTSGGESWCQVSTMDGAISGWAREKYLRRR